MSMDSEDARGGANGEDETIVAGAVVVVNIKCYGLPAPFATAPYSPAYHGPLCGHY